MKVFGIGFHKTGTKSLSFALKTLGYNVLSVRRDLIANILNDDYEAVFKLVDEYDAFEDNPWPIIFKILDEKYPNSKFILTLRDERSWIKSVLNHFGDTDTEMRKYIYGVGHPKGNEDIYLERYKKHNLEVVDYFKERKNDLLIVSWENGDSWLGLCEFLGRPVPDIPFPHLNKGNYQ